MNSASTEGILLVFLEVIQALAPLVLFFYSVPVFLPEAA